MDSIGNTFVTGGTRSTDYPTTPGAFNTSNQRYGYDVFVTKINANGTKLVYSTYIIGTSGSIDNHEEGNGIAVDTYGNAFVTGYTSSSNFPTTPGAYDNSHNGDRDVFVLKLNRTGASLDYSTYVGGSGNDDGAKIVIDKTGNAFITGVTAFSSGFPTTPGAYDTSLNGIADGFVLKLNQNGSSLKFSTFIGGNEDEGGNDIVINKNGELIITGFTNSLNFPTTKNAINRTFNGGRCDIFVAILNKNGSSLDYSTYLGGSNTDAFPKIEINSKGEINIIGNTSSSDFPVTDDAFDKSYNDTDIFLTKLSYNGSELLYSTYIGGSGKDYGQDISIDGHDNVYLTGYTFSFNFPVTPNAYDTQYSGVTANVLVMKWFFRPIHNINSVMLMKNNIPVSKVYSKYGTYTFSVNLYNTVSLADIKLVRVILSPLGDNIQFRWDRSTGQFIKLNDPNNYITIEPSSRAYNDSWSGWTIDFDVTFNWTYPDEELHDVQVYATSTTLSPAWFNVSKMYSVENDLVFIGNLSVKGEDNRTIYENELVRGGEKLNWSGLKVVYENTTDVFPQANEYNVTLWNEDGYVGYGVSAVGKNFTIMASVSSDTDTDGNTHILNISGIPSKCDKTNESFTIRIDGDNVTFTNPSPDNNTWQTDNHVETGITVTDHGGGSVDGKNITYSVSNDNGITWNDWVSIKDKADAPSINIQTLTTFENGKDNLIKWQAGDTVGNGPVQSSAYRVLVDTEEVKFSSPWPLESFESPTQNVVVGINISDNISGVNAQSVEYSVVEGKDKLWSSWKTVPGLTNETNITVRLNLVFPNGTYNYIKWRASDIAGNGPTESEIYQIKVNTWLQQFIPRVKLWSPPNGSIIQTTSVELIWRLENQNLLNVTYDVYLDNVNPPNATKETRLMNTSLLVTDLSDGETYYWTVIPNVGMDEGWCVSSIWTFTVDTSVPVPSVRLISPENGSIIRSPKPTLQWSLEYEGSEILSYDVYLDTNEAPVEHEKCPNIYFLPQGTLKDNQTYYWKVVPWAGNVKGPESETWSFTVNRDYIPRIELKLTVNPPYLELLPGDVVSVQATVYNLGELRDTISLSVDVPADADIIALVNDPGTMDATPDGTAEFNITITIAEDATKGEVVITVTAVSGKAAEYDLVVEEKAELTVKIFGIDTPENDKSSTLFTFLNILFIIIIIIIILVLVIVVNNRRKREEKKSTKEAVTVKPGEVPTPIISVGKTPTVVQLPGSAAANVAQELTTTTSTTPVLASSPSAAPSSTPQQITQVARLPQLPPAQSKIEGSAGEEAVLEPTVATPSPTLQRVPEESDTTQTQKQIEKTDEDQNKNSEQQ